MSKTALVAVHTVTIGSPEIRDDRGQVIAADTRRDIAPGEAFEADADTAADLIASGAARAPEAAEAPPKAAKASAKSAS